MTKAVFFVILIWMYILPWALFPYFKLWGRFVPGKYSKFHILVFRIIFIKKKKQIIFRGIFDNMHF